MPYYRKKPVEIEARELTGSNAGEIAAWVNSGGGDEAIVRGGPRGGSKGGTVIIRTLEGNMQAEVGDYVIRGVQGEFYPCKPDIFEATYEPSGGPT
jgi:hypothetical protein